MYEMPEIETLSEAAASLNEWFQSLRAAGFTQHQCWHIMFSQVDCKRKACNGSSS